MGTFSRILEKSGHELGNSIEKDESAISFKLESEVALSHLGSDEKRGEQKGVSAGAWDERLTKVTGFSSEIAESFRVLRSKILHPAGGKPVPRTIMVTSVLPQEGKSFVTANLGIALGKGVDQHSLLVDCDLRLPSLAKLLGVSNKEGLVDYLQKQQDLSLLIKKTSVDKLSILPSGHPPVNPSELLGSVRMHDMVDELSARYPDRFVIFDTPPLQVASESIVLSQVVDAVVLVVRHGVAGLPLVERVISDIGKHKIIGVIFNGHKTNYFTSRFVDKQQNYYGGYYQKDRDK